MSRRVIRAAALAAGLALATLAAPAMAQSAPAKEPKIKLDTLKPDKLKLDPRLGYILLRLGPKASPTDRPLPVVFQRIDETTNRFFKFEDGKSPPADFYRTVSVAVNSGRSFGDANGAGTYVVSAFPGRWIIHMTGSTCMSMGTYAFDVKQGEITDIGTLLTGAENGKSTAPELKDAKLSQDLIDFGVAMNIVMTNTLYAKPASDDPVLPAGLQLLPRRKGWASEDFRSDNSCLDLFNRAASLPPLEHRPPMTAQEAAAAIAAINPEYLVKRKQEKAEKAAKAAAAAAAK